MDVKDIILKEDASESVPLDIQCRNQIMNEAKNLASEKGISMSDALTQTCRVNPELYNYQSNKLSRRAGVVHND